MTNMVQVCIGCATDAHDKPRFLVMDECGPLRKFWTKREAKEWMQPWMILKELPKQKKQKRMIELEEALL